MVLGLAEPLLLVPNVTGNGKTGLFLKDTVMIAKQPNVITQHINDNSLLYLRVYKDSDLITWIIGHI